MRCVLSAPVPCTARAYLLERSLPEVREPLSPHPLTSSTSPTTLRPRPHFLSHRSHRIISGIRQCQLMLLTTGRSWSRSFSSSSVRQEHRTLPRLVGEGRQEWLRVLPHAGRALRHQGHQAERARELPHVRTALLSVCSRRPSFPLPLPPVPEFDPQQCNKFKTSRRDAETLRVGSSAFTSRGDGRSGTQNARCFDQGLLDSHRLLHFLPPPPPPPLAPLRRVGVVQRDGVGHLPHPRCLQHHSFLARPPRQPQGAPLAKPCCHL